MSRWIFLGAPAHTDIIEFLNFLLQFRNQKSGGKTVYGFSSVFWKELWRFKFKESMLFVEQKYKLQ